MQKLVRSIGLVTLVLVFIACTQQAQNKVVILATTTSTENSGLLEYLLPKFQADSGLEVRVIAVGTGKALRMGEEGDVDLVMVHAKPAEEKFVAAGFGVERVELMYNDFVLVGPENDPAGLNKMSSIDEVMVALAQTGSAFLSRGDDSGTHKKELRLWKRAGVAPNKVTYRELGQGMGKTLQMANELQAYTMIDRGTWLAYDGKVDLSILFQGVPPLFNQYSVMLVNPERYPDLNTGAAQKLINWLVSEKGQSLIGAYKVKGKALFQPNA
ncbi:MAG: solute-binding protein [Proteobacteria bacterium]|nr:solute-binding protein [Pseudomonadota bacterium]